MVNLKLLKVACADCRLSTLCLPRGLDREDMERLDGIVKRGPPLQRGQYLYRQGDPMRGLFAVRAGSVRAYTSAADGTEQTVGFYLPGELLGFDGLEHERHNCAAVALETTAVCELPLARLEELCAELPRLKQQLLRLIGKEIASDHESLLLVANRGAEERLASFLLSLSMRFGERGLSRTEFNLSMSRRDIANFLGVTAETVSRQLSILHAQGILSVNQRKVRIHDLDRLGTVVEPCMAPPKVPDSAERHS